MIRMSSSLGNGHGCEGEDLFSVKNLCLRPGDGVITDLEIGDQYDSLCTWGRPHGQ